MIKKIVCQITQALLVIGFACTPSFAYSDELRIPVGQQAQDMASVDMPTKGMSKEKVRDLFGKPEEDIPAKGTPPISRWKYKNFTVYFDSDVVIHSVRNFQPNEEPAKDSKSAENNLGK
ncbi:hypothetical protein [Cellvibrio sp. UBA7661]|uniref:hypothetical protein n=1 Tax=Cellvibrio sp. UBA7661 TaxID=1946311 RepID=UPI002F350B68